MSSYASSPEPYEFEEEDPIDSPTLEELCVRKAIDNLDRLGDVGHTDLKYLKVILPHCNEQQLRAIETATQTDISSVTNELWQNFYRRQFGNESYQLVLKRLTAKGRVYKWKDLLDAKLKEQEEVQEKCVESLREKYRMANEKKASRQLQSIDLTPPPSKRRKPLVGAPRFGASTVRPSGSSVTPAGGRGRLMKKARQEFASRVIKKPQVPRISTGGRHPSLNTVAKPEVPRMSTGGRHPSLNTVSKPEGARTSNGGRHPSLNTVSKPGVARMSTGGIHR